jgi:hypothetical protein
VEHKTMSKSNNSRLQARKMLHMHDDSHSHDPRAKRGTTTAVQGTQDPINQI